MSKIIKQDQSDYIRAVTILEKIESGEMKTKSWHDVMEQYDLIDDEEPVLSILAQTRDIPAESRVKHNNAWKDL
jgi:hypothetical protein